VYSRIALWTASIREQDPLKQGLKLNLSPRLINDFTIREQDPLKQGLKPAIFRDRAAA